MAYELHIERPPANDPKPIHLEEWQEANLLNAEIRGDEGEAYDATSGQMI